MGIYSLVLLFLGIFLIGLVYAKIDNNRISHHVIFAIILSLFLIIFFTIHHHFQKTCAILIAGNLDQTIRLIRSWGVAAPLMSMLLMVIQAIVASLPAMLVTAANGMIFGGFWGAVISWTGAMMGALTSFYVARLVGDVALGKVIRNQRTVEFIRHAGEKRGFYVILLSRLLPFISFDLISYMAGLSGIRPWAFILATALGMLPATIIYTFIGHEIPVLEEHSPIVLTITVVFIFILIVFSLIQGVRKKA
ncbi:MAG: TVP38/TMEM64 family protein [Candidatus Aminicenantes bacterium]|nr:TVP38/TMEM64 family protein [Candidatus Aminicenantes bacterium]NIQ71646.1 TVP38/TMEM64 family protein [Candidatus Aminicenantes bacterium]NIT27677.1 TVP38/TMEM64 family protein [Candidatus Aminicenantes bacterium]